MNAALKGIKLDPIAEAPKKAKHSKLSSQQEELIARKMREAQTRKFREHAGLSQ